LRCAADEHPVRRQGRGVYVIEVNPRASRTVPFVSKAIGVPLAKLAAKVMAGKARRSSASPKIIPHFSVKEAVFPFNRFPGIDIVLGPEMKSTGEVMGIDADWGMAYAKSQMAAFNPLPTEGNVFLSVSDRDKDRAVPIARDLVELGFKLFSTGGTGRWLNYAKTGDGGNKLLRLRKPDNLHFSILQRVSPDMVPEDVIRLESTWKDRLHTRGEFGLNVN
jgi:hypothetical protein